MSPSIEVDDDIFEHLKSQAEPFTDTPSTVLRRLLNMNSGGASPPQPPATARSVSPERPLTPRSGRRAKSKKQARRTRAPSGSLLPEQAYEKPLLQALVDAGGEAPYRNVLGSVGKSLEKALMPADFEKLRSGGIRWHSRLQFVRLRLIERGELDRDAPRGVWRITDAGRKVLANEAEA
jgi:hypothetical protein